MQSRVIAALSCLALLSACGAPEANLLGTSLTIKGSDTEVQLVSNLAESFAADHVEAQVAVTGGGSATGIAALLNGEIDIANSSRPLSEEERAQAAAKGLTVGEFILARDGLSIVTHPSNPIETLTIAQLAGIYAGTITDWSAVGGTAGPIVLYGRQSTSGTYGFFRDTVVKADYAPTMRSMEGSQAIVDAVRGDTQGIGYVGVGYVKGEDDKPVADLRVLTVKLDEAAAAVSPLDREAVLAGRYPISRPIYQYVPQVPAKGSLTEQFLRFEASPRGQEIVEDAGFYPVTADDAARNDALLATTE